MPRRSSLGGLELDVLRFITEREPVPASDVVKHFGITRGLARTTVVTVMDRLRKKGHLTRKREGRSYQYSAKVGKAELLRALVHDFVENALGGSVSPFVAYLSDEADLGQAEITKLYEFIDDLRHRRGDEQR